MFQDFVVTVTFGSHDRRPDLAHAHAVSPSGTVEDEPAGNAVVQILLVDHECRTEQVGAAQHTAYFQLLSDDERLLCADDFQPADMSAPSALYRDEVEDAAKVRFQIFRDESGQFVLRIFHAPTVEVRRLPVVVVQHLAEYFFVFRVAERRRVAPYPLFRLFFPGKVRQCRTDARQVLRRNVSDAGQVRQMLVFPTVFELFGRSATAFRETCVADVIPRREDLAACGFDGFHHGLVAGSRDALIALAMVVGAYVEYRMVFAVVPTDQLPVAFAEREESPVVVAQLFAFFYLGIEPAPADDGRCFQELGRGGGTHFAGNDTDEVIFYRQHVDGRDFFFFHH